jgi:anaerobic selenocysteine-containing dehydrogenase
MLASSRCMTMAGSPILPKAGTTRRFSPAICAGFARVLPYLLGESDGQPKDADWAAAITGVSAETIRALACAMAAARTMLTASWSLQRADHGEQAYWALVLLAACLGQIGLPGGGFGFGYDSSGSIAEPPPVGAFANPPVAAGGAYQAGRRSLPGRL